MLITIEIIAALVILAYGTAMARFLPQKSHYVANVIMVASVLAIAKIFGVSLAEMGLSIATLGKGFIVGMAVSAVIIGAVLAVSGLRHTRPFFMENPLTHASRKKRFYESFVRIPLSTALIEELLFRGFFLGLLLQNNSPLVASLWCSLVFGIWHIAPTLNTLGDNQAAQAIAKRSKAHHFVSVLGTVFTTAVAGLVFC